jgi:hypothetical protein
MAYPAGHIQLSPAQAARLARIGLKRSMPDIWIFYKAIWCIETKDRDTGKLSKTRIVRTKRGGLRILEGQEDAIPALLATGAFGDIAIARSVDEVFALLRAWKIPHRSWR